MSDDCSAEIAARLEEQKRRGNSSIYSSTASRIRSKKTFKIGRLSTR